MFARLVTLAFVCSSIKAVDVSQEEKKFTKVMEDVHFNRDWKPKEGEQYCYALALSGGGAFGTYETGVAWGLLHYGDPKDYEWDVFTGVSAGSINAAMFSVWPKGQEKEMSEWVSYECTLTTPDEVIASWPGLLPGPVDGLLYHGGLYDNSPMSAYLDEVLANFTQIEKKLVISAVDVNTGAYHPFDESVGKENLGMIVRASASIPFAFAPTPFQGGLYMDGGTVWNVNIKDAIDKCLEIVPDQEHIVVDVAITEYLNMTQLNETGKTINNFWRQHQIKSYYKTMNDIAEFMRSRPDVNYRHFFKPSQDLGGAKEELDFRNQTTWQFQMVGRQDAYNALNPQSLDDGPAPHTFEHVLTEHLNYFKDLKEEEQHSE